MEGINKGTDIKRVYILKEPLKRLPEILKEYDEVYSLEMTRNENECYEVMIEGSVMEDKEGWS